MRSVTGYYISKVSSEFEIYIDGASKGNPGPGGIGVVVCRDGVTIKNVSVYIGRVTNNVAEYNALIYGLKEALTLKAQKIKVNTDSELLYRQIKKIYKIKSQNLLDLYNQARHLMSGFEEVMLKHIPREQNRGADKLATQAVKNQFAKSDL